MCLGVPLQVIEIDAASEGTFAWCEGRIAGELRRERLNILWLGEVLPGEWVFASLGQAKERLTEQQADEIRQALEGVQAALAGETQLDRFFPDLTLPAAK
jgi:hydrogenase assembly chaperone HypC/HupF